MFKPRLTRPEAGNPYYIRKASGGYSDAIQGSPKDQDCDVLSNCVGYAYGRFNEIGGWGYMKYLKPVNAENFIRYCGGLEVGQTPRPGACMVWQKGVTLSGSDGAGHVAIVEKVLGPEEVLTSESAWGGEAFTTAIRRKGANGWWGQAYKFLGFIYNPAVTDWEPDEAPEEGEIRPGDVVSIREGAAYYGGQAVPAWVQKLKWIVLSVSGDRAVVDLSTDGSHRIRSPFRRSDLVPETPRAPEQPTGPEKPTKPQKPAEPEKPVEPERPRTYTVRRGDSLWAIAARLLGSGARWPEIYDLNGLKSTVIHPGQTLKIPEK